MKPLTDRLAWALTMATLVFVALLSPALIEHVLKSYRNEQIKSWWRQ